MRTVLSKFILVALTLSISSFAMAGFHLEPYIGHTLSGKWEQGDDDDSFTMTNFGTKLGYQSPMGFQIGGELQLGTGDIKIAGSEFDTTGAAFGLYLGYQSFMGLRGYFSYLFSSGVALDIPFDPMYMGSGFKLGVGYLVIEWLAINLEYITNTFDELKSDLGDGELSEDLKANAIMLTVSFPFDL